MNRITLILLLLAFSGCARPQIGGRINADSSGDRDFGVGFETTLPQKPNIDEVAMKRINDWIKENDLNEFGDPKGTVYTGGTPLFGGGG